MQKTTIFLFSLLILFSLEVSAQSDAFRVGFYNVENLFDLKDDPEKLDDDFTPAGKQQWTQKRYATKLGQIAQVMNALDLPAVMGFCEIENTGVLEDVAKEKELSTAAYRAISYESPDLRGIDVGMLYDENRFVLLNSNPLRVEFPLWLEPEGYTSRDILHVELLHTSTQEVFHFFVNHWPSRRGGAEASEHRRLWVAAHLRRAVDKILSANPLEKIIIMGDFNDEPLNRSVSHGLGTLAITDQQQVPSLLYNPFLAIDNSVAGSYNYRDEWNVLDQIMYAGLQVPSNWEMSGFGIFSADWLLYEGTKPNRTYGGPNYYGGYSDHLPVFLDVRREE